MSSSNTTSLIPLPVSIGAQLVISHLAAAITVLALMSRGVGGTISVSLAVLVGLALTFTLQRSLSLFDAVMHGGEMSLRWHGPLAGFARSLKTLVDQSDEVSALRQNLVTRVQDTAAQQERNRLARDLHDSIKQQIFSISMSAAAAQARWEQDLPGAQSALDDVRRSAQEAMVEMNALLQQLAPAPLEKVGLVQALRDQCEALGYRAGAQVTVEVGILPDDDRLPAGTQLNLFRIAQEALSNIARHARAQNVRLYLGQREAEQPLILEIVDDGQGFEMDAVEHGMGLTNTRQRIADLGGTLVLDSVPGQGTTMRAAVPLVEAVYPQEDVMRININHTPNKVCLAGLIGGLVLIAVLYYPLYVVLPGAFLQDWQEGSPLLGTVLQGLAALVAVGIGYVAARWGKADSRRGGVVFGALAGGIAGAVLYFGLAGAAAGVVGSGELVRYGVAPAADDTQFLQLLAGSVIGTIWWTLGAFWAALLGGIGLGAIGGALVTPSAEATSWKEIRAILVLPLYVMTLTSAVMVCVTAVVFGLQEPAIRNIVTETDMVVHPSLLNGITLLPVTTALIVYLLTLSAWFFVVRAESREAKVSYLFGRPMVLGTLGLVVTLPVALMLLTSVNSLSFWAGAVATAGAILALARGAQIFRMGLDVRHRMEAEGLLAPLTNPQLAVYVGAAVGLALLFTTQFRILGVLVVLVGAVISWQASRRAPKPSIAQSQLWSAALQAHLSSILASATGWMLAVLTIIPTALTMVLISVPVIPTLVAYEPDVQIPTDAATMTELVQSTYTVQLQVLVIAFIAAMVLEGIIMLLVWGVLRLQARRQERVAA